MEISFSIDGNRLLLCWYVQPWDSLLSKLLNGENYIIKNTFSVNKSIWLDFDKVNKMNSVDMYSYIENEGLCFVIGSVDDEYIRLSKDVLMTNHVFYYAKAEQLNHKCFIANRNISIFRRIDKLIENDIYIGGNRAGLPIETFIQLLNCFPNSTELNKYSDYRVSSILREYFSECDVYESLYDDYLNKKRIGSVSTSSISNLEIESQQFSIALSEVNVMLKEMLKDPTVWERKWQDKIKDIICLIFPKYIHCDLGIKIPGFDDHDKIPDFILVDTNGYIDIMEIKRPNCKVISDIPCYRNNYLPTRDFVGTVQQMEKYIISLISPKKEQDKKSARDIVIQRLKERMNTDIELNLINPQGILLLGRSDGLNNNQRNDLELIKRQYKNIVDIMTYDDLINRLENIISSLNRRIKDFNDKSKLINYASRSDN